MRSLDAFFPFDPYLLKRSSKYLELKESYISWRHGHPQLRHAARAAAAAAAAAGRLPAGDASVLGVSYDAPTDDGDGDGTAHDGRADSDAWEGHTDDSSGSTSSSGSDDELDGMSLPEDSFLARPGLGAGHGTAGASLAAAHAAAGMRPPVAPGVPAATHSRHHDAGALTAALYRGGGAARGGGRGCKRSRAPYGSSLDSGGDGGMGMSYSPGGISPAGVTPSGTSPVMVSYLGPAGGSPMQMTPVVNGGHMERYMGML